MPESRFDEWIAERYEALWPELFEPSVLEPAVELLATLAATGDALEFGIGTGRVALPLRQRGIRVHGIDLSPAMVAQLRTRPGGSDIGATVGDFATTRVNGRFTLVYLLRNTITNLTSQREQVEAFRNAARHLAPGGRFVIENFKEGRMMQRALGADFIEGTTEDILAKGFEAHGRCSECRRTRRHMSDLRSWSPSLTGVPCMSTPRPAETSV